MTHHNYQRRSNIGSAESVRAAKRKKMKLTFDGRAFVPICCGSAQSVGTPAQKHPYLLQNFCVTGLYSR
jgi:hypothetical protein